MSALAGRVALVTGAARGIGRAIAEELAARGAKVVVADNGTGIDGFGADPTPALQAAAALGANAVAYTESIASPASAEAAVQLARHRFDGIDILVNNAAILRDAFVFRAEPGDVEAVIRNNLLAPFFLARAASAVMREQGKAGRGGGDGYAWGRIVNIVSTAGLYGNLGQAAYAAAKAGLVGLTRVAAMDLARAGVAVNAVAPFAATRVTETIRPANDAQATYKQRALRVAPEHVARFVAFLAGDGGRDITGQLFGVRGREVLLFGQPRPAARVVSEAGAWDDAGLARAVGESLRPAFTDLTTDLEAFSDEPHV